MLESSTGHSAPQAASFQTMHSMHSVCLGSQTTTLCTAHTKRIAPAHLHHAALKLLELSDLVLELQHARLGGGIIDKGVAAEAEPIAVRLRAAGKGAEAEGAGASADEGQVRGGGVVYTRGAPAVPSLPLPRKRTSFQRLKSSCTLKSSAFTAPL